MKDEWRVRTNEKSEVCNHRYISICEYSKEKVNCKAKEKGEKSLENTKLSNNVILDFMYPNL